MTTRDLAFSEAINEAIRLEMRRDPRVIVMGVDVAGSAGRQKQGFIDTYNSPLTTTKGLIQEFGPERVLDTPISEAGFLGAAIGAAATGMRPIVELMMVDFVGVCLDQILNNASKMRYMYGGQARVPLVILTRIGLGMRLGPQHSACLYSLFAHIPGLKSVAPSDPYTAKGLLLSAIRDDDPVVVLEHKRLLLDPAKSAVPEDGYVWPIGKARILKPGKDVTLVGISTMSNVCLQAMEELAKEGIEAEVVDLLSLAPMDEDTILTSVRKTKRLVVVDEDHPRCSMATDIAALAADKAFEHLVAPIKLVTPPNTPVPYSPPLEDAYVPSTRKVVAAVQALLDYG